MIPRRLFLSGATLRGREGRCVRLVRSMPQIKGGSRGHPRSTCHTSNAVVDTTPRHGNTCSGSMNRFSVVSRGGSLEIRKDESFLEILHSETAPAGMPSAGDLRFSIKVSSDGFSGSSPHVWTDAEAFSRFLDQLKTLEAQRKGMARLEALSSPDEFWLEIRVIDRAGHLAVFGRLRRWASLDAAQVANIQAVEFGFEFCPTLLPQIVSEFQSMAS